MGKIIVEYNGDFWHANPFIYSAESKVGRNYIQNRPILASEKWARDARNISRHLEKGYSVLVIWASSMKDPNWVIKAKNFLIQEHKEPEIMNIYGSSFLDKKTLSQSVPNILTENRC